MMNITRIKPLFVRQTLMPRPSYYREIPRVSTALMHASSVQQKSIVDKAKDLGETVKKTGHDVNLKVGQELAHGIEEAEAVLHHTKKVGEKAKQSVDKTRHATQDSKSAGKSVGATVEEEARRFGEQLQQEKETKMAHVRERAGEVKQAGEETLSEGVDRVEDAIQDTSEKLGAEESKESNQAKHRLEDEVEDAVQRLQHKRD